MAAAAIAPLASIFGKWLLDEGVKTGMRQFQTYAADQAAVARAKIRSWSLCFIILGAGILATMIFDLATGDHPQEKLCALAVLALIVYSLCKFMGAIWTGFVGYYILTLVTGVLMPLLRLHRLGLQVDDTDWSGGNPLALAPEGLGGLDAEPSLPSLADELLAQRWTHYGPTMDPLWTPYGTTMEPLWNPLGPMDPPMLYGPPYGPVLSGGRIPLMCSLCSSC